MFKGCRSEQQSHNESENRQLNLTQSERGTPLQPNWVHHPDDPACVESQVRAVNFVPPSVVLSSGCPQLFLFEDHEAVIKMCIKGRSPTLRYVSRTHRVDLDWLIERIKRDPGVNIKFAGTDEQLADMLTKGSFTVAKWISLLDLHQIGNATGPPARAATPGYWANPPTPTQSLNRTGSGS